MPRNTTPIHTRNNVSNEYVMFDSMRFLVNPSFGGGCDAENGC